jgi:phosphoglycerol transferase
MARQLEVVHKLGFEGIYIDRRGYADNAEALIAELSKLLQHPPLLQSDNKELVFFKLDGSAHPQLVGLSAKQIMAQAGYSADALGPRIPGNLASGIDFTQRLFPDFISGAAGLSAYEPWGRWSAGPKVDFDFADPLPQIFTVVLKAQAFASNAQKPTRVKVGNHEYSIQLTNGVSEVRLDVDLKGTSAQRISFFPPTPISPKKVTGSNDERTLGIGFVSMRIVQ